MINEHLKGIKKTCGNCRRWEEEPFNIEDDEKEGFCFDKIKGGKNTWENDTCEGFWQKEATPKC